MSLEELQQLCRQGEGQYLEFKQYATEPDQITEEFSGFLNSTGGSLLVGIKDDGIISGLKYAEDDLAFLEACITKNISPPADYTAEIIPVSKKRSVIHFRVKPGSKKPYGAVNSQSGTRQIFYRSDDKCLKASRELKNILRGQKKETGQTIRYTAMEADILKIIDAEHRVQKNYLNEKLSYSSRQISDCLVRLTIARVIKIIPTISGDLYQFNPPS